MAKPNIRFNAVRPGLTLTDSMAFVTPDSPIYQSYDVNTPMGDGSDVDDVAQLVSFLLSQRARRMTGQVINVDGGLCLRRGPDWSSMVEPRIGGHEVALGRRIWSAESQHFAGMRGCQCVAASLTHFLDVLRTGFYGSRLELLFDAEVAQPNVGDGGYHRPHGGQSQVVVVAGIEDASHRRA